VNLILAALAALLSCAVLSLVFLARPRAAALVGAAGPTLALALALPPSLAVLGGAKPLDWRLAAGAILPVHLGLDALSAFFLLAVLLLSALSAVYGVGYLDGDRTPRRAAGSWAFFDLLVLSMAMVVLARHAILFLLTWETMALASFFLVVYHHEKAEVRQASWTYLVATHLGSLCLPPMFFLLASHSSLDFDVLGLGLSPEAASICFLLALVGFGTKAGVMPFHVWLPEAHPAAPSHVSALMSGVMIKTGIYGLVRVLTLLGEPPLWWGWLLLALGGASAFLGVLFALAQHDLKRLLAYHSIENIGIIVLGLGAGVVGLASGEPMVAALGFAGALLHVLNHAVFKGLLFMGAGSVMKAAGTGEIDELGGLLRRMPVTGATFLVGSVAISGLPPLNGFVSELLVYWSGLLGATRLGAWAAMPLGATVAVLGAVGALALACFTKAFGIVFLGSPRSEHGRMASDPSRSMKAAMLVLAAGCVVIGLAAPLIVPRLAPLVSSLGARGAEKALAEAGRVLAKVSFVALGFLALVAVLALARRRLLARREVRSGPTWDCGYVAPVASMQYTASSYAQPLTELFGSLLRTRKRVERPEIHFPDAARLETETPDFSREGIYEPLFETVEGAFRRIRVMQHGRVQIYVLGVVLTLVVLLLSQVR
jgi:formate hydrogenlyase subunit 3/multisubunit Na+/H+ antiporter MnhD subunit